MADVSRGVRAAALRIYNSDSAAQSLTLTKQWTSVVVIGITDIQMRKGKLPGTAAADARPVVDSLHTCCTHLCRL